MFEFNAEGTKREVIINNKLLNVLMVPKHWPRPARRAFVLTLPISGTVLLALWCVMILAILVAAVFVVGPLGFLRDTCRNLWE